MSTKFRKKPVVIEAYLYDGTAESATKIIQWADDSDGQTIGFYCADDDACRKLQHKLRIPTLEGTMFADPGDWIIKGVQGEFYPCNRSVMRSVLGARSGWHDLGAGGPASAAPIPESSIPASWDLITAGDGRTYRRHDDWWAPLAGAGNWYTDAPILTLGPVRRAIVVTLPPTAAGGVTIKRGLDAAMDTLTRIVASGVANLIRGLDAAMGAMVKAVNWVSDELGFTSRRRP